MDSFTYRDKVAITLTNRLTEALESGQVSEEEGALIAGYLLDRVNQIDDEGEASLLLTEMAERWPIFEQLFVPNNIDTLTKSENAPPTQQELEKQEEAQIASDQTQMEKIEEALGAIQQQATPQSLQGGGA